MDKALPHLLMRNYQKYGTKKVAMRKKDLGIWRSYTWADYYQNVKYFSLGLMTLGIKAEEKVSIIGDNDPEWFWADIAAQSVGAVPLGIFPDSTPPEMKYIIEHSDTTFVLAKDQEQVDKILSIKDELPQLKKLIYWDPKGLWFYKEPMLMSFEQVLELGKEYEKEHPTVFEECVERCKGDDLALLAYTSGTTGLPKGVMISHRTLIRSIEIWFQDDPWYDTDEYLSYICPAWVTEHIFGIGGGLVGGVTVNFPEEPETVQENIREIGPQCVMYTTRLWEDLARTVQAKINDSTFAKRLFYHLALRIGNKVSQLRFQRKRLNPLWLGLYGLAHVMVFRPLKSSLGLLKTRICYTGGAALAPDTLKFYSGIGVNLKQLYALTEAMRMTMHRDNQVKPETVGHVHSTGVEVKISDEGEILVRGDTVFQGYYKDPEATNKRVVDGWLHTGDAGHFDKDEQLVYLDRLSELIPLGGGKKFSPQFIESSLRFSPYIKDAIAIGGEGRDYVTAIIIIDLGNVGKWAERRKIAYTTFTDLSQKPEVYDLVREDLMRVNNLLPEWSRIRRYTNLYKEFDPDEAELTRTRKLRRGFLENRYSRLIDAMYGDVPEISVEAEIKYRDGRVGTIKTPVKIESVEKGIKK